MALKYYLPTGVARLRWKTKQPSTGTPFAIAAETFGLTIFRDGVVWRACQLSRGSTDTAVASTGFHYAISGVPYTKAAVAAGTALAAGTIPQDKWGAYLYSINAAGTVTSTAAAANFTTGYDNEAAAIAALPSTPGSSYAVGFVTVQTEVGSTFVGGTDALAGGASGNPANATNYYTLAERLASASPSGRGAITFNEGAYGTGSHENLIDVALSGGGADPDGQDEVEVYLTAGTVDSISVVGDPVGTFGVAEDGLTAGQSTDVVTAATSAVGDGTALTEAGGTGDHLTDIGDLITAVGALVAALENLSAAGAQTAAEAAITAKFGIVSAAVATDVGNSETTFKTSVDQGAKVVKGTARMIDGDLEGESCFVTWTGTQITVRAESSMVTGLKQYSDVPADAVNFVFTPL